MGDADGKAADTRKGMKDSGVFVRTPVRFTHEISTNNNSVVLREFDGANDCDGAVLVEGFPTNSLSSILVAGYLREALKLPLIGVISSPQFPPRCLIEDGRPVHPVRIFGNSAVVVVLSEFKLPNAELTDCVTKMLFFFAKRHKLTMIVTVEGVPMDDNGGGGGGGAAAAADDDAKKQPPLLFVSTSAAFSARMLKDKHEPLDNSLISGVSGAIMCEGPLEEIDVSCLITPHNAKVPDANCAVVAVRALKAALDIDIDVGPLEAKAKALQASVQKLLATEAKEARPSTSMYL